MFICFDETNEQGRRIGCGKTLQSAISNWCGEDTDIKYMEEYEYWRPRIIKGEEIQIDSDGNIQIIEKT